MMLLQIGIVGGPLGLVRPARAATTADLRIGTLQTVDSLNPYRGINDPSYLLYGLLYDYPFAFDQDGNFIPNLITSATCDAVCQNWTYTVRSGVKWSDNTTFSSVDVNFTFNLDSQNLKFVWAFEPYFNQVVQCGNTWFIGCGARINPANSNQVTVYFKRPFAPGKSLFAPIVQQAQWSKVSPSAIGSYSNSNPIGTGPFIADPSIYSEFKALPAGPLHVSVNRYYHPVGNHTGPSFIQNIYIYEFNDINSLVLAMEAGGASGGVDVAAFTTTSLPALDGYPNVLTQRALQAIQEWNEIGISQANSTKLNPARYDIAVRLAMAHATNKDYILQQFYDNQGVRGDSLVSPVTRAWWYDPVAGGDNLSFDLTLANQILDNAGYTQWSGGSPGSGYRILAAAKQVSIEAPCYQCVNPPNSTVTIPAGTGLQFTLAIRPKTLFPEEYNTAYWLQAEYAKIGIQITVLEEKTENALSGDVYGGNVEMYIWYWSSDEDPNYMLSMESSWTLDGWNDNYWNNGTYNHYYLQQLADQNVLQRQADVKMAQRVQYESASYIIYIFPYGQWAMRTDDWTGWGNWSAHPYRQLNAYWGANPLFFDLQPVACSNCVINQPPTRPVIESGPNLIVRLNTSVAFSAYSSDVETTDQLNWTWDWGDGNTSLTHGTAANPTSSASHAWASTGTYTVTVSVSDGWNPAVASINEVNVTVQVCLNCGTLRGTVKNALDSTAIQGAQVTAGLRGSASDATGAYNFSLPPGSYTATASKFGYSDQSHPATITANSTTWLNFTLTPNEGWIKGTVTSTVGNASVKASIFVKDEATGHILSVGTNDQGVFNISLEPGTYKVNASANGYQNNSVSGVVVLTGQTHTVWLQLTPISTGEQGLSPVVIGAIVAVVVIVAGAVLAVFLTRRRKKKEKEEAKIELPPKT